MEAARSRLRHLEKLIRGVDARLKLAQPAAVAQLERERARLTAEFDPLWSAVAVLSGLRHLSRCSCGKVSHLHQEQAQQHAKAMGMVDSDRKRRELRIYACDQSGESVFHVGHWSGRRA